MYSPKIDKRIIPCLYRLAKYKGVAMTTLVNAWVKSGMKKEFQNGRDTLGGITIYPAVPPAPFVREEQVSWGYSSKPY